MTTNVRVAFASAVETQLRNGGVWQERGDATPVDGLRRAIESGRVDRAQLTPVIEQLLESPTPRLHTSAVALVDELQCGIPAERLMALSVRYVGVAPEPNCGVDAADLATALTLKAAKCVSATTDAKIRGTIVANLQSLARLGNVQATIELGRLDGTWLMKHASEVPVRDALVALLPVLTHEIRATLITQLAPYSEDEKARFARPFVWEAMAPAEAEALKSAIGVTS